ncbi:MAG: glycogen synthase GlgA [Clostridiales bacterium]|nr:glycogen synthase GlgA [Clostridiales bacterium]MCD7827775.1 glycogen synthase GlgA [Clostridiales bacterium]
MKVLYAVSEAKPFVASGGLGDVAGSLPQALRKRMIGCRVVMPLYDGIKQEYKDQMQFLANITVPVAWRRQYCGIFELRRDGVVYYFIDNQYYFKRDSIYGHYDDAERFAFFSRAVLEIIPIIDFKPDIIHCNDWQTALVPVYYSAIYAQKQGYENIKTVFTIHNIQYQGKYGMELLENVVGLSWYDRGIVEYDGCINYMKGAIETANKVTTVSPTYANEILDPWYSHGLDPILNMRSWKLQGILNGIGYDMYDPETDKDIFFNYSADEPENKKKNKLELQKYFGLTESEDTPIVAMVSRLVAHKGFDLVKAVIEEFICTENAQVVILGSGEWQYENFFRELAGRYPGKVGLKLGFFADLANKIYAGSDIFLMPSKSEPCGLSQMIALRYGSIPIVRETGGLRDSITDSGLGEGNGFTFSNYNAHDMLHTMRRAVEGYKNKEGWSVLMKRAMKCDFSWSKSAGEYIKMYKEILG